jgi:hypothetical protein
MPGFTVLGVHGSDGDGDGGSSMDRAGSVEQDQQGFGATLKTASATENGYSTPAALAWRCLFEVLRCAAH